MNSERDRQRGTHLLDAAIDVLAEDGLGALSMRSVATRAGVSLAQVQYYFRTKSELVASAFEHAGEQFLASIHPVVNDGQPSVDRLRRIVWRWLPLDGERERRARVWLAYAAMAITDEDLAAACARLDDELRTWFASQLDGLQQAGKLRAGSNPTAQAAQLFALIDGLTVQCLPLALAARRTLSEQVLGRWFDDL